MNRLWLILCSIGIFVGCINGNIHSVNQVVIEVGMDTFDFALPIFLTTCFYSGVMEMAKVSGCLHALEKLLHPILKRLFPDVPEHDEALNYIASNIVINMFGLGFAATPSGLKAMEHLQKLNQDKKVASRSMVTFLVLNTAGVTLISANIIALRSALGSSNATSYLPYAILSTTCASVAGLLLDRWWNYRKS